MTAELQDRINELLRDELLILAEAEDGASVEWATRPLSPEEVASGVRFGDIHQVQVDYLAAVEPALVALMGAAAGAVVVEAGRVAMSAAMLNLLDRWRVAPPESLAQATAKAAATVEAALTESFDRSARLVAKEAATQGVRLTPATSQTTAPAIRTISHTVANTTVDRVLDTARKAYSTPAAVPSPPAPSVIKNLLADVSPKGPVDAARQANNAVIDEGRYLTVEAGPEPAWSYASEILDGRQCGPCSRIDGTEWENLEDARKAYPPMSGYVGCLGLNRCRGTLVFVWES